MLGSLAKVIGLSVASLGSFNVPTKQAENNTNYTTNFYMEIESDGTPYQYNGRRTLNSRDFLCSYYGRYGTETQNGITIRWAKYNQVMSIENPDDNPICEYIENLYNIYLNQYTCISYTIYEIETNNYTANTIELGFVNWTTQWEYFIYDGQENTYGGSGLIIYTTYADLSQYMTPSNPASNEPFKYSNNLYNITNTTGTYKQDTGQNTINQEYGTTYYEELDADYFTYNKSSNYKLYLITLSYFDANYISNINNPNANALDNYASGCEANVNQTYAEINVYTSTTENYEIVDIPGLCFNILTMPFSFVSQAFNLTLFPGTPFQVNISSLFLAIIGILIFVFVIKKVLGK